uniref:hypothetical protein n=1 Tax=Rothia mucilaginosa TaxID=43675 RepID=UPI0028D87A67
EEALRFFLLAAATHTTIQMPKHPCNPKKGEVAHKKGLERVSNTPTHTKHPSQSVLGVLKNLQKLPKNLINAEETTQTLEESPVKALSAAPIPTPPILCRD